MGGQNSAGFPPSSLPLVKADHPTVWSGAPRTMIGRGEKEIFDPGVGPDRYQRALEAVRREGSAAFAAFTFDIDQPGSMVVFHETIEGVGDWTPDFATEPLPAGRVLSDGIAAWTRGFATVTGLLESGSLEKVVLARRLELSFGAAVSHTTVLQRLSDTQRASTLFLVGNLVGASPELLVGLEGETVVSAPLAGTAESRAELDDPRISKEHRLTAQAVEGSLRTHLEAKPELEPFVVDLGIISHLGTRINGKVKPGTTVATLLADLHPTPAVGGVPTEDAMALIRRLEPSGRGLYAGPVGWMDADGNGEFAVSLRCGVIEDDRVVLHAGGGLVAGASRDKELAETQLKLAPMLEALGVEG